MLDSHFSVRAREPEIEVHPGLSMLQLHLGRCV